MSLQGFEGVEDVNFGIIGFSGQTCCEVKDRRQYSQLLCISAVVNEQFLCWSEVYHICNGSSLKYSWFLILE